MGNISITYCKSKFEKKTRDASDHTPVLPCPKASSNRTPSEPGSIQAGFSFTAGDNVELKVRPLTHTQVYPLRVLEDGEDVKVAPLYGEEEIKGVTYFLVPLSDVWENRASFVGPGKGVRMHCVFRDMNQKPNKAPVHLGIWYNVEILENHRVVFLE